MKNIIELSAVPPKEGDPVQTVSIPIDKLVFIVKIPLQPILIVNIDGLMMACLGDFNAVTLKLELHDFRVLDTDDGGRAVVNPERIMFYLNPELGLFHLMFPGKGINVRTTTEEIQKLFDEKSSIVLE